MLLILKSTRPVGVPPAPQTSAVATTVSFTATRVALNTRLTATLLVEVFQFWNSASASADPSPVALSYPAPALSPMDPVRQSGDPCAHGTAISPSMVSWN